MKRTKIFLVMTAAAILALGPTAALAHWDAGDGHKMHEPQLPDPTGWDVRINNARRQPDDPFEWITADDWQCSGSGAVTDIHFWTSWRWDMPDEILALHVMVFADVPDPDGDGPLYSHPGERLHLWTFGPNDYAVREVTGDLQGWADPPFEQWEPEEHQRMYQFNITEIPDPLMQQEEGTIYWLGISADLWGEGECGMLGWKTSLVHWNDDAVYWDVMNGTWQELRDPEDGRSLDMAFVITPEPATLGLLGLGVAGLVASRRRRRR